MKRLAPLAILVFFGTLHPASAEWRTLFGDSVTDVRNLFFLNADTGWVSLTINRPGSGGAFMLRTFDGGESWDTISTESVPWSFFFVDVLHGWQWVELSGDPLKKTTDGGRTWLSVQENIPPPPDDLAAFRIEDLWFINRDTGWLAGTHYGLMSTTDGGRTWDDRSVEWSEHAWITRLRAVIFVGARHGWAVGGEELRLITRTTDGGRTWIDDPDNWDVIADLGALSFIDTSTGVALDIFRNSLYITVDGGATWERRTNSFRDEGIVLTDIAFVDSTTIWVSGRTGNGNDLDDMAGIMAVSHDRGLSWTVYHIPTIHWIFTMSFPTPHTGYAVGYGGMVKWEESTDVDEREERDSRPPSLTLYPNPHHGATIVAVETDAAPLQLEVIDLQGRVLRTKPIDRLGAGSHRIALDLDGLPDGAYIVRVVTSAGSVSAVTILSR